MRGLSRKQEQKSVCVKWGGELIKGTAKMRYGLLITLYQNCAGKGVDATADH